MYRVLIIPLLLSLGACDPQGRGEADDPKPTYACIKTGEPYSCRGGPCYPCIEHGIKCPTPTTVVTKDDKLVCRLPETMTTKTQVNERAKSDRE